MTLIKKISKTETQYYSHLARRCCKCHTYIMPGKLFLRIQYDFINYFDFHLKCKEVQNGTCDN